MIDDGFDRMYLKSMVRNYDQLINELDENRKEIIKQLSDVVIEGTVAVANIWRDMSHLFNCACLSLNCLGVSDVERLTQAFRPVFIDARASGKMKRVDVVCAIFLDDGNNVLAQAGENRSDRDRGHHADDDAQHCQKTSELVGPDAIERHPHGFP